MALVLLERRAERGSGRPASLVPERDLELGDAAAWPVAKTMVNGLLPYP